MFGKAVIKSQKTFTGLIFARKEQAFFFLMDYY